jgi:hypothetical protein
LLKFGEGRRIVTRLSQRAASALLVGSLLALAGGHAAAPTAAAANGVDARGSTTYTLLPAARVVRVVADLTVRNVTADTATFRYYYTGYGVGIQPEARAIKATRGSRTLRTSITRRSGYQVVNVSFGTNLFRNQSIRFRLQFDLPDGGARSKSSIRVGRAFAGFYGYAFGQDSADVRIVLPPGFKVTTREGERMTTAAASGGATVLSARGIRRPDRWWVFIAADAAAALRQETFDVTIGAERKPVTVKSWPEDQRWLTTVRGRLEGGLPIMGQLIGLPWPVTGTLEVVEVFSPLLGGYAGVFYEPRSQIRITEDPDELVILHEASHAWFNGGLASERWINEGLADEYAALTLARLGASPRGPDNVDRRAAAAFALNDWPAPRSVNDAQTEARERYGYNASWHVMRDLVAEIGEGKMRAVFQAAAARQIAYVGEGEPETVTGTASADWRTFLDLLEERGGSSTAASAFTQWVITPAQKSQVEQRATARRDYGRLAEAGDTWRPPYSVRLLMARWNFPAATDQIKLAERVLDGRDAIVQLARSLDVRTTPKLEQAYESSGGEILAAQQLADEQLATLQTIDQARARVAPERTPVTVVGLFGDDPDSALAEARRDFEQDDLPGARSAAQHAVALLEGAAERGVERLRIILASLAGLLLGGAALIVAARRRRRNAVVAAAAPTVTAAAPADEASLAAPTAPTAPTAQLVATPGVVAETAAGRPPAAEPAAPPEHPAAPERPAAAEPPDTLPANFRRDEEGSG